jgi:hypothetical protein
MYDGLPVIDADAHKMENPVVFFDYLEPAFRARLFARTDRYGQQRLVVRDLNPRTGKPDLERVFPQVDGPGKGATVRSTPRPRSAACSTASASSTWTGKASTRRCSTGR